MATIRRRGKKFQAMVRKGQHSQSKTFSSKSDAEHWSKKLEVEIERSEAMLSQNKTSAKAGRDGRPHCYSNGVPSSIFGA